jgi:replicative DNA helicase
LFVAGPSGVSAAINAGVSPASFYAPHCAALFHAIVTLAERNQAPTVQAVLHELNFSKAIEGAGGMPNVLRVVKLVPTHVNLSLYIVRVRELQLLRAIARTTRALHEEAFAQEANVPEFAERVERTIFGLAQDRVKPARTWEQAVAEAETEFEAMLLAKPGSVLAGEVSWGFADMDRFFGPMAPGQLVILAARPSVGKSSLMRQTAYETLKTGKAAYIASLEVKDRAIARNIAQAVSGISYRSLRAGAHPADADDFRRALAKVKSLPLVVSDDFSATVSQICAQARLAKARRNLGLVCVDHLHELGECKNPPKGTNTAQAYGRAVKAFKELAGELGVPVLVLAQLNRGSESDKRVPPSRTCATAATSRRRRTRLSSCIDHPRPTLASPSPRPATRASVRRSSPWRPNPKAETTAPAPSASLSNAPPPVLFKPHPQSDHHRHHHAQQSIPQRHRGALRRNGKAPQRRRHACQCRSGRIPSVVPKRQTPSRYRPRVHRRGWHGPLLVEWAVPPAG